ncbi:MAG TPA: hypothetical protein VFE03_07620 [Caulobacteraceae bacterium]|nr:hypothetical protein [Caulobacteraceae bacterium]
MRSPSIGASLFSEEPDAQWTLPKRLREISGLAVTPDGRVMGHDDETAVIYQLDIDRGEVIKRFSLGDPVKRGDFEGIAIDDDGAFYLTTSTGRVYCFREGDDRAHVAYESFDTGLRDIAEIEGLAYSRAEDSLILACKTIYAPDLQGMFALFAWSPRTPGRLAEPWLVIPLAPFAEAVGAKAFHPSSLEIDARTGRLVVLAARQNAMVELAADGTLLAARRFGKGLRQAEGATIMPDGALVVAREGGDARALMRRYARVHD